MISEKTVELNISRVVIEKCRRQHQRPAYAVGFTQSQESVTGVDVGVQASGWTGGFIQYKTLKLTASGTHRWNLNRTKNRNQHSLLCHLESLGFPVFYCFPKFNDAATLSLWTPPPLWTRVWWMKPSSIPVPAPVDTHHHVERNPACGTWNVFSDSPNAIPEDALVSFDEVESRLLSARLKGAVNSVLEYFKIGLEQLGAMRQAVDEESLPDDVMERFSQLADTTRGLSVMAFGAPQDRPNTVIRRSRTTQSG